MEQIILVENLHKTFPLQKKTDGMNYYEALRGISFFVNKGEIFGILGPNGAGKTTTLEILEGLKQQSQGLATILGFSNLTHGNEIKSRIGVQLQTSEYLPLITLGELLDLFASFYGKTIDRKRALAQVGLLEKENELVKNLSGGQKQRFTIATSLVNNPEILFLDEPTTGLDPHARRQLWKLVKDINTKGITIVLTTHYMEEAEFLCHRVAVMDQGKILKIDEPKKLIEDLSHTTQISFLVNQPCDTSIFKNLPDITEVYSEFPKIILEIKSLENIQAVLDALKLYQISFSGFTVKTATLEDVYLRLTGKQYES